MTTPTASRRLFRDRTDAGRQLAARLLEYRDASPMVLGLPRGGVPVAYEVACALQAPLDVWVVRRLGAPIQPELSMGAVAEGGEAVLDETVLALVGVSGAEVDALVARKSAEAEAICRVYRRGREGPQPEGRTVILVDDGIATGGTVRAALRALWRRQPKKIVLATPVAGTGALASLRSEVDEIVCVASLQNVQAIRLWYEDFPTTSDDEVIELLDRARVPAHRPSIAGKRKHGHPKQVRSDLKEVTPGRAGAQFPHDLEQTSPSRHDRRRDEPGGRHDHVPHAIERPDPESRGGHDRIERKRI